MDILLPFFVQNSPYIFLVYVLIKEFSPIARAVLEKIIPERIAKRKALEERHLELEEKQTDLRERETVAMENIQKHLFVIQNNQSHFSDEATVIMAGITAANQGIMVLLDRNKYYREEDVSKDKSK